MISMMMIIMLMMVIMMMVFMMMVIMMMLQIQIHDSAMMNISAPRENETQSKTNY